MSDQTKYQEGIITLSDGTQIPFLCRPLSSFLNEEEMKEVAVADIKFLPEVDRAEEVKDEILKEKLDDLPQSPDVDDSDDEDWDSKIEGGIGWDDAY